MYTPYKPQVYYIKVEFQGSNIILACFRDDLSDLIKLTLFLVMFDQSFEPRVTDLAPVKLI